MHPFTSTFIHWLQRQSANPSHTDGTAKPHFDMQTSGAGDRTTIGRPLYLMSQQHHSRNATLPGGIKVFSVCVMSIWSSEGVCFMQRSMFFLLFVTTPHLCYNKLWKTSGRVWNASSKWTPESCEKNRSCTRPFRRPLVLMCV